MAEVPQAVPVPQSSPQSSPMSSSPSADMPAPGAPEGGVAAMLTQMQRALAAPQATERVTLRHLAAAMPRETFPVLILLFALLLVSPLSAIPGATTLFGLSIATILAQQLLGRAQVWLPGFVLDRPLPALRTRAALDWLRAPVDWLDRRLRPRQAWVFAAPVAPAPPALVLAAALCAPVMEVIPGSGTSVGAAITVFSAGLLARDGLLVLAGAILAAVLPLALLLLLT